MTSRRPPGSAAIFDAKNGRLELRPIQQLADSNIIGVHFTRDDGTIVDANDEFLRIVGYSREDLEAGRVNWRGLTPPDWSVATREAVRRVEETGKAVPFEKEYFRKDGTRVPVLVGIVTLSQQPTLRMGIVLDQTETRQAARDLDRLMIERFAMLDSVGDGIYGLDREGLCTFINAAGAEMLGYTAEECQGLNMHALVHSRHADGAPYPAETCPVLTAFRTGVGVRVSDEVVWRKDGSTLAVEYSSFPIVVNGRVEGSVVTFKDISDRRKAAESLRASEARFRSAFADAAAGMCITDLNGRFLEVNQALCRMTGYTESEMLAINTDVLTHPDDRNVPDEEMDRMVRREIPSAIATKRYVRKDGSIAWARCSVAPLYDTAGSLWRFVTLAEDITEQVKAKSDLRHTEDLYRCIIENTSEGICMCDASRNITYRSARLTEMLAYPKDRATFECADIHFEEDQEEAKRRFDLRMQGVKESYDTRLKRADGSSLMVNSSASPIPDEKGGFSGSLCMFTDITAGKQLEDRLRQVQKMEALGQLAGGVAHDFNNLLTVILGYGSILERKLGGEDPLVKNVVEIRKAGERAAALTQKLLAFSRKQVLSARLILLNHLVQDMESMLRRLLGERVELVTVLDPAVGSIKADPGQMEQVILNLSINARDAMPRGGRLVIESKRQELNESSALSRSLAPGSYALITFTDNGCGMDAKTMARIFEPFFTTKEPGLGTGLGLSTVLGIVNQSGGYISVYSEVNVGTTFKVLLPLVEHATSEEAPVRPQARRGSGEVILVAEDDDAIRGLAQAMLEEQGYRVVVARSAEEALAIAQETPTLDLLLTDLVMRGMNGHELANRLLEARPGLKVLYMSGYSEIGIIQQGVLQPGRNFLSKPFEPRELVRAVSETLAAQSARARILVVDDDVQVRSFLTTLLEADGYRVFEASNGKEALARCRESLPGLMITDLVMPEQEGLETIHSISETWPDLPMIAISGALGGAYLELAKKLGADAVIRKPFEPAAILREVERLVAG